MQASGNSRVERLEVRPALIERTLAPYKDHCRYLHKAWLEWDSSDAGTWRPRDPTNDPLCARGEFAINESCYIADTGHFNAVEYNICYNQLTYVLLAAAIEGGLLKVFSHWNFSDFRRRQLGDFLIFRFESEFRSQMLAAHFVGMVRIEKVTVRNGIVVMKTKSEFSGGDGRARGEALIGVVNSAHAWKGSMSEAHGENGGHLEKRP
jgi:hypothetical protein